MAETLAHRGPDDIGVFVSDRLGLAVRRLSIIDPAGGHQPLANEDQTLWIAYNGEVYNYRDLQAKLVAHGHQFRGASDTEVLLHLYEEEGPRFVTRLRGMFAFALWDGRTQRLLLARDRLGIKPLYLMETDEYLIFASEIKALFASGLVEPDLDHRGLVQCFVYGFPVPPRTVWRGVREMRPGHWLLVEEGHLRERTYWALEFPPRGEYISLPAQEAAVELRERLVEVVKQHLQADVPVGTYLSGGIDSSLLTALVKQAAPSPKARDAPQVFSLTFEEAEYDESLYAQAVAEHLRIPFHEVACRADTAALLPQALRHAEQPLPLTVPLVQLRLAAAAREAGVKVVLTGEGADEALAGYGCFRQDALRRRLSWFPLLPLRKMLRQRFDLLLPSGRERRVIGERYGCWPARYAEWKRGAVLAQELFPPEWVVEAEEEAGIFFAAQRERLAGRHPLHQSLLLEFLLRLPRLVLLCGDRMSMAQGVEARVPFLDHELVEFCASLPPHYLLHDLTEKWLLRQAAAPLLPPTVVHRPKQPLFAPLAEWFFGPEAPEFVTEALSPRALANGGCFDPVAVHALRLEVERQPPTLTRRAQEAALLNVLGTQLLREWVGAEFPKQG